jgi:hypothetical protein
MDRSKLTSDEVGERGQALYDQKIRQRVETEENIGKVVVIDIETGEFGVDDTGRESERRLHRKHPGAALYAIRIGYNAYAAVGGSLKRTAP